MIDLSELNLSLKEIKSKLTEKRRLESLIATKEKIVEKEKKEFIQAEKQMNKEAKDVERLERKGITSMFLGMIGKKDQVLAKDRMELEEATHSFEKEKEEFVQAEAELRELLNEVSKYQNVENQYDSIMSQKENIILSAGDDNSRKLRELKIQLQNFDLDIKLRTDALPIAENAVRNLERMHSDLEDARRYAMRDIATDNDNSTYFKEQEIRDAKSHMWDAKRDIERLRSMFNITNLDINIEINESDFLFENIFDNPMFDRMVIQKIEKALYSTENAINRLDGFMESIERELDDIENRASIVQENFVSIIENYK